MLIRRGRLATSLLVCIALAGCAASQSAIGLQNASLPSVATLPARKALPAPGRHRTGLWVADLGDSTLRHYTGTIVKKACQVTGAGGFGAISVDGAGNVYVPEFSNQQIEVYSPTCELTSVISDSEYVPLDAVVAPNGTGTVAITNYSSSFSFDPGNVTFIKLSGGESIATGLLTNFYFGAFDRRGNFYTDGFTASGSVAVGVIAAGSTVVKATKISGIGFPGGIAVARNGTVNIDDQDCSCIKIFKNSEQVGTVDLNGTSDAVSFALNKENTALWVADAASGTVSEYAYPGGGAARMVLSGFNEPYGVAVYPAARP